MFCNILFRILCVKRNCTFFLVKPMVALNLWSFCLTLLSTKVYKPFMWPHSCLWGYENSCLDMKTGGDIQTDSMQTVYNSQVNRMKNGSLVVCACFSSTAFQFQTVISAARNLNYWKQQFHSVSGTVHINQLITSARLCQQPWFLVLTR